MHLSKNKNLMKQGADDRQIKEQIEAISGRIDKILKQVKRYYPLTGTGDEAYETGAPEKPAKPISHDNQPPEQEA